MISKVSNKKLIREMETEELVNHYRYLWYKSEVSKEEKDELKECRKNYTAITGKDITLEVIRY